MFDLEREQLRKTYQLCRLGFGFIAVALVLACFDVAARLVSEGSSASLVDLDSWHADGISGSMRRSSGVA